MTLFLELHIVLVCIIFGVVDFRRKSHTCTSLFHFHNVNLHSNLHLLLFIFIICVLALRFGSKNKLFLSNIVFEQHLLTISNCECYL